MSKIQPVVTRLTNTIRKEKNVRRALHTKRENRNGTKILGKSDISNWYENPPPSPLSPTDIDRGQTHDSCQPDAENSDLAEVQEAQRSLGLERSLLETLQ